jgi:hypothetical protein
MTNWKINEADFDKQFEEAISRTAENFENEPRIDTAFYDRDKDAIFITLLNSISIIIPRKKIPELKKITPEQLSGLSLSPLKETLAWDDLDIHIGLKGLIIDYFQLLNWMGPIIAQKNGMVKSEAKAESARLNGAKGGRPRKEEIISIGNLINMEHADDNPLRINSQIPKGQQKTKGGTIRLGVKIASKDSLTKKNIVGKATKKQPPSLAKSKLQIPRDKAKDIAKEQRKHQIDQYRKKTAGQNLPNKKMDKKRN